MTNKVHIDSIGVNAWASEMQEAARTKKSKVKPVIYPIFQEVKELVTDPIWINKLEQASRGKFPPKIAYHNQRLSKKGQKQVYVDLPYDAREARDKIMGFFMAHSPQYDMVPEVISGTGTATPAAPEPEEETITWAKANKKVQEALKCYFITDQKDKNKLNRRELAQLRQLLNFGLVNRIFNKNTITVFNKRITHIEGLHWNPTTRQYFIDEEIAVASGTSHLTRAPSKYRESSLLDDIPSKDTIPQFSARLNKYLDSLERKLRQAQRQASSPFLGYQVQIEGQGDFDITEEEIDEDEIEEEIDEDFD